MADVLFELLSAYSDSNYTQEEVTYVTFKIYLHHNENKIAFSEFFKCYTFIGFLVINEIKNDFSI